MKEAMEAVIDRANEKSDGYEPYDKTHAISGFQYKIDLPRIHDADPDLDRYNEAFDDAIAEKGNVVHRVNQGWTVAKRLLQHERSGIHTMAAAATATKRAQTGMTLPEAAKHYLADDSGSISDATLRDEITQHGMNERSLSLTQRRTVEESEGGTPGAATSIFKFYGAEVRKTQLELQLKVRGTQSLGWEGDDLFTQEERELTRNWLGSKAGSIAGGSKSGSMAFAISMACCCLISSPVSAMIRTINP